MEFLFLFRSHCFIYLRTENELLYSKRIVEQLESLSFQTAGILCRKYVEQAQA